MVEQLKPDLQGADCNIPNACDRIVPTWLIVLDNAPTAVLFLLGTAIMWNIHPIPTFVFLVYCCLSIVLFWKLICPWCHHFGTTGCPCGYSSVAVRLFRKKTGKEFKRVFRRNIVIVFQSGSFPLRRESTCSGQIAAVRFFFLSWHSALSVLF